MYVDVLSEKADCKATLTRVLAKLHRTFIAYLHQKWMFVIGDAKAYNLLQSVRFEYGNHLDWLIPTPGDWHTYNYQEVLMKGYGDAGLITLAKAAGFRAENLNSLIKATNFRLSHLFCFKHMICTFFLYTFLIMQTLKRVYVSAKCIK